MLTNYLHEINDKLFAIEAKAGSKTKPRIAQLRKEIEADIEEIRSLRTQTQAQRESRHSDLLDYIRENPGCTYREAAAGIGTTKKAVQRALDGLAVQTKPRKDLPKIFGNHPTGLWVSEEG